MSSPLRHRLLSLALLVILGISPANAAEPNDLLDAQTRLDHIDELIAAVDSVREWDRDGLNTRIDQLAMGVIEAVTALAPNIVASGEATARAQLLELLDRCAVLARARERYLERRAAAERQGILKFEETAQADIARVFIDDLRTMRLQYFGLYVDQLEMRRAEDLPSPPQLEEIRAGLLLSIERRIGHIRLDAISLNSLREQLDEDGEDENLRLAYRLVHTKQNRNLRNLERSLDAGERLAVDVAEARGLLIRERGQLGLEILERDVFEGLWTEQFNSFREELTREGPDVLFRLALFFLILALSWLVARLIRYPLRAMLGYRRLNVSNLMRETLLSVLGILVFLAGLLVALSALGLALGPLFAGLGVIGILVGLALQESLGNLAAGVMILIYRPFDVDDHIRVAGADGIVKRMNLLSTTIMSFDNQQLMVPNGRIWGDTIVNLTASHVRRVDLRLNVAYREDMDHVHEVLLDEMQQHESVLKRPAPDVHMVAMEDSAIAVIAKPWVKTEDYWSTLWDLNRRIKKRFDAEGIEIPFPQRVVTLHSPTEPIE
ncbi:MAG: mechanosensitive ion channel family protein [Pseudomonadota bacterium]